MQQKFFNLKIQTKGQNFYEFTQETLNWIKENNFTDGILNLNIQHTSASLVIQENADPDVKTDLLNYFDKLAPMNGNYIHSIEGKDDMPAHIKSALTNSHLTISLKNRNLLLGKWQGIYLFEHRLKPSSRIIIHHFLGK